MTESKHRDTCKDTHRDKDTMAESKQRDSFIENKPLINRGISEKKLSWDPPHEESKTLDLKKPLSEHFKFLATIGKGAYGSVYLVENNLCPEESYAIKQIKEQKNIREQHSHISNEISIMSKLQGCPFVIEMYASTFQGSSFNMIMENANGGDLFYHLRKAGKFDQERTKFYAAEILLALEHIHDKGIIYRDLKPENVLIDHQGHVKIIDFGLSKNVAQEE